MHTPGLAPDGSAPDALDQEVRLLELLQRTGATLAAKLDVHGLVQTAVDTAAELAGAQLGAIFFHHGGQDRGVFSRDARSGAPRAAFAAARGVRGVPLLAATFVHGELVLRGELGDDELPPGDAVRSYLAVPLVLRAGELIGGIFLGHRERHAFTTRTQRLITGIAAQAAIALANARIYEDLRRASEDRAHQLERERAARAELERVGRRKDELLRALSHELRAPLNAILGWSEVLLARGDAGGEARTASASPT